MSAPPAERDFSAMASVLAPDVKLYQSPDLPYGGTYTGHEEFRKWSEAMAERFDKVDPDGEAKIFEQIGGDGTELMVLGQVGMRVRKTGKELTQLGVQYVKVDRQKGFIVEIRPIYWDVAALRVALGK